MALLSDMAASTPRVSTPDTDTGIPAHWWPYYNSLIAEHRLETWAQQALQGGLSARQALVALCGREPRNGNWPALLVHTLRSHGPAIPLAYKVAQAAMVLFPLHSGVRLQYWATCAQVLSAAKARAVAQEWLPHVATGAELQAVLRLLGPVTAAGTMNTAGVVHYAPVSQELYGWVVNLANPHDLVHLNITTPEGSARIAADQPHAILQQAGLSATQGGFRVRVPELAQLAVRTEHGHDLCGSPLTTLAGVRAAYTGFAAGAGPAVGEPWAMVAKPGGTALSGAVQAEPGVAAMEHGSEPFGVSALGPAADHSPPAHPVDILIPVYKGYDDTLRCVHSVLNAQAANRTAHQIVVLDDHSPEPRLSAVLQALAAQGKVLYVRHPANLGFIRSMNRGMALHTGHDVVWLNADTLVHGNWLDRLQAAAYQATDTASACPFTNNGELLSFPEPQRVAPMPDAQGLAQLDTWAAQLAHAPVPLPMSCGFCMYIKRAALTHVGLLDEAHLQRGYGEESDWCLRAHQGGWHHVAVPSVFVAHAGGVSFGAEKAVRVAHNNAIIRQRFPLAERSYQAWIAQDPLAPARKALQQALIEHGLTTQGMVLKCKSTAQGAVQQQGLNSAETAALEQRLGRQGMASNPKSQAASAKCMEQGTRLASKKSVRVKLNTSALKQPCAAWWMLDYLITPELGERWLQLAKALAHQGLRGYHAVAHSPSAGKHSQGERKPMLNTPDAIRQSDATNHHSTTGICVLYEHACLWEAQWHSTGRMQRLPAVLDLPLNDRLALLDAGAAVSLAAEPSTELLQRAAQCGLPVYAPPGAAWKAAGARPLAELPRYPASALELAEWLY